MSGRAGTDLNNALNETSDPQNQATLGSSMDLPHGIQFDAQLRWVDTLHNNNNGQVGTVPTYTELNVRLGFRLSDHAELSSWARISSTTSIPNSARPVWIGWKSAVVSTPRSPGVIERGPGSGLTAGSAPRTRPELVFKHQTPP